MNKAELLRQLSRISNKEDEDFMKYYDFAIKKLTEAAQQGKRSLCWYDISYADKLYDKSGKRYSDFNERLRKVLEEEGFTFKRKCEVYYTNQVTMYVWW